MTVTTTADPATDGDVSTLRRLASARAAFAVVWAGLFAATAADLDAVTVALLLVYPLVDLGATAYDARGGRGGRSGRGGSVPILRLNAAASLLAAVGLAVAAASGVPDVLRVWGAWAVVAGVTQLVVAVRRRGLPGQTALILSGGISVLAGGGFVASAGGSDPALTGLAGYAALGAVFFLVSAVRLRRP